MICGHLRTKSVIVFYIYRNNTLIKAGEHKLDVRNNVF